MNSLDDTLRVLKTLSDRNRLRILLAICCKPVCVCELSWALKLNQPNVSRHLSILQSVNLVESNRVGNWINYSASNAVNIPLIKNLVESLLNDNQIKQDREAINNSDRNSICIANSSIGNDADV